MRDKKMNQYIKRINEQLKAYQDQQNNDSGVPRLDTSAGDVSEIIKQHQEMLTEIQYWLPYIEGSFEGRSDEFEAKIDTLRDLIKQVS